MSDTIQLTQLAELAQQQWYFRGEIDDNLVSTYRRDPNTRGAWIGPLTSAMVGLTFEDEDGDECFDMTGRDGLYAAITACLPDIAALLLVGTGCDDAEVRARCQYIVDSLKDDRDHLLASDGMSNFKTFEDMIDMFGRSKTVIMNDVDRKVVTHKDIDWSKP